MIILITRNLILTTHNLDSQAERDQPPATYFHVNVTKVRTMNPDGQRPTSKKKWLKESNIMELKVSHLSLDYAIIYFGK